MKLKTVYICSECSHQHGNWSGKCSSCGAWNSLSEDVVEKSSKAISKTGRKISGKEPQKLSFSENKEQRYQTGFGEFDRVLGGGIVKGGLILLSGEPGIGKSTITLQIAANLAKKNEVTIFTGEESVNQIAKRANRLKIKEEKLSALNEINLEQILATIEVQKPPLVIVDSIQVISSHDLPGTAGSISQVRYCTEKLMEVAKTTGTSIILIGHVTKSGNLAGPRVLEHLVDTVLHLEGDRYHNFRILKTAKNRFGSCSEVGLFDMGPEGLKEVKNPSKQLLAGRAENAIGSAITVSMEGTRPILVEVQALVSTSPFGYPKRTSNGFDLNRLQILIAVLEKYGKINLQNQDVFINVIGGIKLTEPAADLAVLMAIASSISKQAIKSEHCAFGEVGLSGEIRNVNMIDKRIEEAEKMGFTKFTTPKNHKTVLSALEIFSKSKRNS